MLSLEVMNDKVDTVKLFQKAYGIDSADLENIELCDIDMQNAMESLSAEEKEKLQKEIDKKKAYTNVYLLYGYEKVYAESKEKAFNHDVQVKDIHWVNNPMRLKAAPSRYLHELRFYHNGSKRVTHSYDGNVAMDKQAIISFLSKRFSVDDNSIVEYTFIVDGNIKVETEIKTGGSN